MILIISNLLYNVKCFRQSEFNSLYLPFSSFLQPAPVLLFNFSQYYQGVLLHTCHPTLTSLNLIAPPSSHHKKLTAQSSSFFVKSNLKLLLMNIIFRVDLISFISVLKSTVKIKYFNKCITNLLVSVWCVMVQWCMLRGAVRWVVLISLSSLEHWGSCGAGKLDNITWQGNGEPSAKVSQGWDGGGVDGTGGRRKLSGPAPSKKQLGFPSLGREKEKTRGWQGKRSLQFSESCPVQTDLLGPFSHRLLILFQTDLTGQLLMDSHQSEGFPLSPESTEMRLDQPTSRQKPSS